MDGTQITLVHEPENFGVHRGIDTNFEVDFGGLTCDPIQNNFELFIYFISKIVLDSRQGRLMAVAAKATVGLGTVPAKTSGNNLLTDVEPA
jgi:hypothetical protein